MFYLLNPEETIRIQKKGKTGRQGFVENFAEFTKICFCSLDFFYHDYFLEIIEPHTFYVFGPLKTDSGVRAKPLSHYSGN